MTDRPAARAVPRPSPVREGVAQRRRTIIGREAELALLDTACQAAATGGRFALVTGAAGSGRTMLLDAAADAWRNAGVVVLRVSPPASAGAIAGFAALLHAVRDQYERLADPALAGMLSGLGARCAEPDGERVGLAQGTAAVFALIGNRAPTVLIADDAGPDLAPALAAAVRDGCLVVAACPTGGGRLGPLADVTVDLPPLGAEAVRGMLARRYGVPLDDALPPALGAALGPLAGHPGTVLQTVQELAQAGRLTVAQGHLCLLDPQVPIALPESHRLLTALRRRGPIAIRLATMAAVTRFGVDDLPLFADATLGRLAGYGWILDELVSAGVLVAEPHGGIRPQSPALAARLATDAGPAAVARMHRAYAAAMFRRTAAGAPPDRAVLADHVTSAGVALPFDRRTAGTLVTVAADATDREPDRAAHWLHAALRHAGGGPTGDDILVRLLRLLVRTGQVTRLAEVVHAAVRRDDAVAVPPRQAAGSAAAADLAAAAALVALHSGTPLPAATRSVLAVTPAAGAVFDFADRWVTGAPVADLPPAEDPPHAAPLIHPAELGILARAVSAGLEDPGQPADELLLAGASGDLVSVLRLVLGERRYGVPVVGSLAAYHRLQNSYANGDLSGLLSAAREAELAGAGAPLTRHLARLWAAEAFGLRGRAEEATAWLRSVPDVLPYAALRWWAANGPAGEPMTAPDAAQRLHDGRLAYERQLRHGSRIGVEQLLVRAAGLAARFGLGEQAAWLAPLADPPGVGTRSRLSLQSQLLVRALIRADPDAAARGGALLRARGHRPELADACLALGRVAEDPRPWLHEAQELAPTIASPWLRSAVAAAMRERGVRQPRSRPTKPTFSEVEMQIIGLIRHGRTNRQIAVQLRMSEKTIENYLTRLFARTGCRSRVELATASLTTGILRAAS